MRYIYIMSRLIFLWENCNTSGYCVFFPTQVINRPSVTGVWLLLLFDNCIFKIETWQVTIKAMNKLIHPHSHYPSVQSKSEGPGCEQTGVEDKAFIHVVLICLLHFLETRGAFCYVAFYTNILLKGMCWPRISPCLVMTHTVSISFDLLKPICLFL